MIKKFLKDRLLLIIFYLLSTICLITFFNLINEKNEIFYPLSMSLFLLIVYIIIDFLKNAEMNRAIEKMLSGQFVEMKPITEEQKGFHQLLQKVTKEHSQQYNQLKNHYDESIYFLSHWMHHLKTPVSVIDLILENEYDKSPELVEKIQRENKRIYNSIEQGLTMLRLDHFEKDLEVHRVELLSTLRKLMNEHRKACIYHSIYPIIDCDSEQIFVATDSKWNDFLLNQIISNAIKYSSYKDGKKQLIFKIEQKADKTTLSVVDEGIGIPPYDIERVFEPFFTGENGRKYPNSTGIGLYISKKIAEKLGHTISIESNSNGTTVHIQYFTSNNLTSL